MKFKSTVTIPAPVKEQGCSAPFLWSSGMTHRTYLRSHNPHGSGYFDMCISSVNPAELGVVFHTNVGLDDAFAKRLPAGTTIIFEVLGS